MNYKKIKIPAIVLSFGIILGLAFVFLTSQPQLEVAPVIVPNLKVLETFENEIPVMQNLRNTQIETKVTPLSNQVVFLAEKADSIYYNGKQIESMHSLNVENATYHEFSDTTTINKVLTSLKTVTKKSEVTGDSGILINFADGTRDNILFLEKDYPSLAKVCDTNNKNIAGTVEWLTYMDTEKILSVRFNGFNAADRKEIIEISNYLKTIETIGKSEIFDRLPISPVSPVVDANENHWYYDLDISFPTGTYSIIVRSTSIHVRSTHMTDTIVYEVSQQSIDTLRTICERISKTSTYKQNPLAVDSVGTMNIYNNDTKTYVEVDRDKISIINTHLDTLTPIIKVNLGKALTGFNRLETIDRDGKTYTYDLFENGFTIKGTGVANKYVAGGYTLAHWGEFVKHIATVANQEQKIAYWFGLMKAENIKSIFIQEDGTPNQANATKADNQYSVIRELRGIEITGTVTSIANKSGNSAPLPTSKDFTTVFVNFKNNITYTVYVSKDEMIIHSSDMKYSLGHKLKVGDTSAKCLLDIIDPNSAVNLVNPALKPVIYLYPEKTMDISVELDFDGEFTYTYPAIDDGWEVTATPESVITNKKDNSLHYYLFWEGIANEVWQYDKGSVIKGEDTEEFLVKALTQMGLTPKEYNDFIVYWVPLMQSNPYNLISFSGEQYDEVAKLTVTPTPDSILRVYMMFKSFDAPMNIEPQEFEPFERKGFTVVEWGGTELS